MIVEASLRAAIQRLMTSHTYSMRLGQGTSQATLFAELIGLAPVPPTCQSTSIEHMKVNLPVCLDACSDHQTTSTIGLLFYNVRGPILTPVCSPDENTSRVAVQSKLRLITDGNPPPIILCP
ncbi:hypothetical protein TNCV_1674951 [Trichonephila clavipes]|nr:hypothetical protein TNCV_1674951 [Trichonephila clavipes]